MTADTEVMPVLRDVIRRAAHFAPLMEALQRYVDSDGYEDEIKEQARAALKAAEEATS